MFWQKLSCLELLCESEKLLSPEKSNAAYARVFCEFQSFSILTTASIYVCFAAARKTMLNIHTDQNVPLWHIIINFCHQAVGDVYAIIL